MMYLIAVAVSEWVEEGDKLEGKIATIGTKAHKKGYTFDMIYLVPWGGA